MRDDIHHSSFGALEYSEREALAMTYIEMYGAWYLLWIENVAPTGTECILTTNRPRQCVGDLMVHTVAITEADNHGFSLWDVGSNAAIPITSVVANGNTITLSAAAPLSGTIEVGYAARGVENRPVGTPEAPSHSATWGNIKMVGRDAPAVIPRHVQPTLDHWLCKYKKIHNI